MIQKLHWDTSFFSLDIGQAFCSDDFSNRFDFDLIYIKGDQPFSVICEGFENTFTETKVLFIKEIKEAYSTNNYIYSAIKKQINPTELYELAFESGKHSRFLKDHRFGMQKFKELYQTWVNNSINQSFADEVFIYQEQTGIQGMVTVSIKEDIASIGLTAVSLDAQGNGIGKKLLENAEQFAFQKGAKHMYIPTQMENKQACDFYKKRGYIKSKETIIKHNWKI